MYHYTTILCLILPLLTTDVAAVPVLEERTQNVCKSGIYKDLVPYLRIFAPAQTYCTVRYPLKCTSKAKRAIASRPPSTTSPVAASKIARGGQNPTASIWSKCQRMPKDNISTLCSCIQTPKACPTTTTTRVTTSSSFTTRTSSYTTTSSIAIITTTSSTSSPATSTTSTSSTTTSTTSTTSSTEPSTTTTTTSITSSTTTSASPTATAPPCTPGLTCSAAGYRYNIRCGQVITSGQSPNTPVPAADAIACRTVCDNDLTCVAFSFSYETSICTTYSPLGDNYTTQEDLLGVVGLYEQGDCPIVP